MAVLSDYVDKQTNKQTNKQTTKYLLVGKNKQVIFCPSFVRKANSTWSHS